jgi:hypothetical protein
VLFGAGIHGSRRARGCEGWRLSSMHGLPTRTESVSVLLKHDNLARKVTRPWPQVILVLLLLGLPIRAGTAQDGMSPSNMGARGQVFRAVPPWDVAAQQAVAPPTARVQYPEPDVGTGPRPIIVGLPQLREGPGGRLHVQPNVSVSSSPPGSVSRGTSVGDEPGGPTSWWTSLLSRIPENLGPLPLYEVPREPELEFGPEWIGPPLEPFPMEVPLESSPEPVFGRLLGRLHGEHCDCCREQGGPLARRMPTFGMVAEGGGIGRERLAMALFEIDVSQPQNNFRFRVDLAGGFRTPDRAEYFFAGPARGPLPETSVDYQDLRFLMEMGGPKFSIATEVPIRILDPERNPNTAGLSDLNLTTKTVLLDGNDWQLTQIFRTYFNTGAPGKGLGTGHISIEPECWHCTEPARR